MPDPSPLWSLHKTPKPSEKSFSVLVSMANMAPRMAEFDAYLEGALFKDFPIIPDQALAQDDQFGLYRFTDSEDGDAEHLRFFFGKNKTAEEANTPYRRQFSKFGNHRWHPILKNLVILENTAFPRSTNFIQNGQQGLATGPSYDDRYIYIPDVNEGSRFFTEEFVGSVPFNIPQYRVPIPTGIQYSMGDLRGSFPEALHDDIVIPMAQTSNAIYLGGQAYAGNGPVEGQFFPRTNFKTWLPYIVYDEQQLTNGVWYRKRIRVFPPLRPKAIRRA